MAAILKPDIIMLTESWLNEDTNNAALSITGYRVETDLRRDRTNTANGIGGGLVVYSKEGITVVQTAFHSGSDFSQFCEFKVLTSTNPVNLILVYRSPNSAPTNTEALVKIMENLAPSTILIGDFNLPGIDWEENKADRQGRPVQEKAIEEGLEQLVTFPTHIKGNRLDLVLTNCPEKVISVGEGGRLGRSDHCIIVMEVRATPRITRLAANRPDWRKANTAGLRDFLGDTNWRGMFEGVGLEEAWRRFKHRLKSATDKFVPLSAARPSDRPRWLSKEIIRAIRRKKRAWRTLKQYNSAEARDGYSRLEREVKNKIRNAKRRLEREVAATTGDGGKRFSNFIKSKTKTRSGVGPLKNSVGKTLLEAGEMAEELNKYFSSVFTTEDLTSIPVKPLETGASLSNVSVTRAKIRKKILNLREDSAAGPDNIQPRLLRSAVEELLEPLELLFKWSLSSGIIPEDWKSAVVAPIFKKGTKGDPGNYRPVSLTSVPCKMLEALIKDDLMEHLIQNSLIRDSQHGFMAGRSCTTNLIKFMDSATKILDTGSAADIFYLDISKAFDKVPRERLLVKLEAKGVNGNTLAWVRNWLTGRSQTVKVQAEESSSTEVKSGVPQGTVLGPVLFIIFIDDLDEQVPIDLLIKFADDTKGLQQIAGEAHRQRLQEALDRLCEWAVKWGMEYNVKKCKIMHIGRNNPRYEYTMMGERLKEVEEEKDVGVIVHKSLKPTRQCTVAANTAGGVLRQISRNFHYRDRKHFKSLYCQYVRPHLEFAAPAWAPWLQGDIQILENIQRRAVNMVSGLRGKSYEEKLVEMGMDSLLTRRKRLSLVQTFKILKGFDKIDPDTVFSSIRERQGAATRATADPSNLEVPRCRLDIRKHSFTVRAAESWNQLTPNTKNLTSVRAFKNALL